jgi:hypothetical protein
MKNQTLLFPIVIIATLMLTNIPIRADDLKVAPDLIIIRIHHCRQKNLSIVFEAGNSLRSGAFAQSKNREN